MFILPIFLISVYVALIVSLFSYFEILGEIDKWNSGISKDTGEPWVLSIKHKGGDAVYFSNNYKTGKKVYMHLVWGHIVFSLGFVV